MSSEFDRHYETLGLNRDASPEEVKKAYFRLVRKFTPEKDPEQFQKIRQAYEALKDGPPETSQFPPPTNEIALYFLSIGNNCYDKRDYQHASVNYEIALNNEPDNPLILWRLATTLLKNENSQKAAKYAERLTKLCPESRQAFTVLANALDSRGWKKKALPAFQKAYELGNREAGFLVAYASNASDNHDSFTAAKIYREVTELPQWKADDLDCAFQAFCGFAQEGDFSRQTALDFLAAYESFAKKYHRSMDEPLEAFTPLSAFVLAHPKLAADREILSQTEKLTAYLSGFGKEWKAIAEAFESHAVEIALENAPYGLHEDWGLLVDNLSSDQKEDEQLARFAFLDGMLCVIRNWEQLKPEYATVKANYPSLLRGREAYFDELEAGNGEELFKRLKWEFDKLSSKYSGSEYLKRYPEKKETAKVICGEDSFTPYVRSGEKVGRNDPCPCGSGKKFKKCCMGKGVYD